MTATIENEKNYAALVIRVPELHKLPNSDSLYGINIAGISVVVNNSWLERVGELAVMFPAESQISAGLASFANLYRHSELNRDQERTGYLEDSRRVRALKLRGNVSKGLILPVAEVAEYVGLPHGDDFYEEGTSLDTINGIELSRKYVIAVKEPQNAAQAKLAKAFKRVDSKVFPEHIETDQWLRNEGHVTDDEVLIVTQKLHGTSVRFGRVPVKVEHKWYERLAANLGVRVREMEYDLIGGSRKVIKDPKSTTQNHFYATDVWTEAALRYGEAIPENYIVYGELVGYTATDQAIQKGFTYEAEQGEMDLYVYRVAVVTEQGELTDLSWDQVRHFATTRGLKYVPELWRGFKRDFLVEDFAEKNFLKEWEMQPVGRPWGYPDKPVALSKGGTGKDEGIVIRVDQGWPIGHFFKYKNDSFFLYETKELDSGEAGIEA